MDRQFRLTLAMMLAAGLGLGIAAGPLRKSGPIKQDKDLVEKCRKIGDRIKEAKKLEEQGIAEYMDNIVSLEIFEGEYVNVEIDQVKEKKALQSPSETESRERSDWEKFEATTIRGRIEGEPGSSVVLVVRDNKVRGNISRKGNSPLIIRSNGKGEYVTEEVEPKPVECGIHQDDKEVK